VQLQVRPGQAVAGLELSEPQLAYGRGRAGAGGGAVRLRRSRARARPGVVIAGGTAPQSQHQDHHDRYDGRGRSGGDQPLRPFARRLRRPARRVPLAGNAGRSLAGRAAGLLAAPPTLGLLTLAALTGLVALRLGVLLLARVGLLPPCVTLLAGVTLLS